MFASSHSRSISLRDLIAAMTSKTAGDHRLRGEEQDQNERQCSYSARCQYPPRCWK
jgi:hypothetical protein